MDTSPKNGKSRLATDQATLENAITEAHYSISDRLQEADPLVTSTLLPTNIAAEINQQHDLASFHANTAISHAKRAGELLLQVKKSLRHGEFLPWVEANVTVTVRQAQRYINAALGKAIPVRAIADKEANTTSVSYLNDKTPDWLPRGSACARAEIDERVWVKVQEADYAAGFYFVFICNDETIDYTIKPVRADFVEEMIFDCLPGKFTKNTSVSCFHWALIENRPADYVSELCKTFLPDGYEHLKSKKGSM
jgi:hypothetical protein